MGWFSRKKQSAPEEHPSYILGVDRVAKRDVIKYLRPLPLRGRVYLLVSDGKIQERYGLQSSLDLLRITFGQYLVYTVDINPVSLQFNLDNVAMAGQSANTVNVSIDMDLDIFDAEALFRSNIPDIKETTQRRATVMIEEACKEFVPSDYRTAEAKLRDMLREYRFDYGVKVTTLRLGLQLPQKVEETIIEKGMDKGDLGAWTGGTIDFQATFEFYDAPGEEFIADVSMHVMADGADYQEKFRRYGIANPEDHAKRHAKTIILDTLRGFTAQDMRKACSQAAVQMQQSKSFSDFGVRVTLASVNVIRPKEATQAIIKKERVKELRQIIEAALQDGPRGLFVAMAADPDLRANISELIDNLRDEETRGRDARNAERDRMLSDLRILVNDSKIVDPEVYAHQLGSGLVDAVQYLLEPYDPQSRQPSRKEYPSLTTGAQDSGQKRLSSANKGEDVVDASNVRYQSTQQHNFESTYDDDEIDPNE